MKLKKALTGKYVMNSCLGLLAGVTVIPAFALGNLLYNYALNRKFNRINFDKLPSAEHEKSSKECPAPNLFDQDPNDTEWNGIFERRRERQITSDDGLKLFAYQIGDSNVKRQVVMVHGYGGDHTMYRHLAKNFYKAEFSVLIPDLRGHGKSEGKVICMGWNDRLDLIKWVELLVSENPNCELVLFGISMGAATVMMASGEKLPCNVKAIIEDCGYTSAADQFAHCLRFYFNIMPFPLLQYAGLVCRIRGGWGFREASAVKQLKNNRLPTLFIHGSDDNFVPAFMIDEVYAATTGPKEKFVVPGADHAGACCVDPEGYEKVITEFLQKYQK